MNVVPALMEYLQQHVPGYSWRILSSDSLLTVYVVKTNDKTEYRCPNENVIECDKKGVFVVQSDDLLVVTNRIDTHVVGLLHPDCFQEVLNIIQSWSTYK